MGKSLHGIDLKLGDVLVTWAGKKRIVSLRPYSGPLAYLWPAGARIAEFDTGARMTIANADRVVVSSFEEA